MQDKYDDRQDRGILGQKYICTAANLNNFVITHSRMKHVIVCWLVSRKKILTVYLNIKGVLGDMFIPKIQKLVQVYSSSYNSITSIT